MDPVRQNVELAYGRPPGRPLRRIVSRAAIGVAGLAAAGAAVPSVVRWGRPHWVAYAGQRDVEAVIAPRGAVVYSDEPAEVARLTGQTQYEPVRADHGPGVPAVQRMSAEHADPNQPGARFRSGMPPVGVRRVPGGPWRLIDINGGQYGTLPDGSRNFMFPEYDVLTRTTFRAGTRPKQLWYGINGLSLSPGDVVTIRAGELDPADEAHFTFDYTINGAPGTVDGYLGADDNVAFTIRTGPATTRPYKPRFGRQAWP